MGADRSVLVAVERRDALLFVSSTVDLLDPELYTHGNPYAVWHAMREAGPVHHQERGGSEFWAVVGHEASTRVLTDWKSFTSTKGTTLREDNSAPYPGAGKMPVLTDPPRHTELRRAVGRLFTPRAVGKLDALAREVAGALWTDLCDRGGGDFVTDVAAKFPLAVSAEILGVKAEDIALMSDATGRALDGAGSAAAAGHHDVMMYYFRELNARRGAPGTDLLGALIEARAGGLALTDEEIVLTCDNIVVAASQTAKQSASGGLLALLESPTAWQALRSGEVDVDTAIEELLRWTAPVTHTMRTAVADTELSGTRIRAGDAVAVWTASANRDGAVFERPDELVLDRHPNPHLTLGAGMHFCLGVSLVRVMLRALLGEVVTGNVSVHLAGPVRWNSTWIVNGLDSLPLTVERA